MSQSSEVGETDSNSSLHSWSDNIVLPLTFASVSRYKTGEDSLRLANGDNSEADLAIERVGMSAVDDIARN